MKRYDSYKDSGVEWIGEIPSGWKKGKLYQYSEMSNGSTPSRVKTEYWEDGTIPWMSSGEINKRKIKQIDGRISREGFENSSTRLLPIGTVMMGLNGQGKTKGTVGILEIETTCNQSLCGMIFKDSVNPMFSYYFLDSQYYHIRGLVGEGQREGISVTFLGRYPFLIPPLSEQSQIVSFLDTNTSLIDSLIEKTQRKIELLKEKRTSLINEVVTKGLNPNVEMKDSGVEWIGEIPSHWEVKKVIHFGDVTLGKMLTPEDKGGYILKPYLRSQNIQSEIVDVSDVKEMWFSESELDKLKLWKGDLLLNEGGDVGRTCMWDDELEECYIQNSVNRLRFFEDSQKYFLYLSVLYHSVGHYDSIVNRVSIPHLTKEKLESVRFLRPPLSEQNEIVSYLDEHTQLIDKTISIEGKRIELLKEYHQSLISEVVTGKIDVRVN